MAAGRKSCSLWGVPAALLDKSKHQPCLACGGKDRFRFTNHKQGGGFICNHCSPDGGSGFDLLMLVYGYTFAEAVQAVKKSRQGS